MKECSAYCDPDKGIHIFVAYNLNSVPSPSSYGYHTFDNVTTCIKAGRVIEITQAYEAKPSPYSDNKYPFLIKVQL